MDPSHANWLHDGAVGKWEDARPMHMRLLDSAIDTHQVCFLIQLLQVMPGQLHRALVDSQALTACFAGLLAWLVACLVGWLADWLVGWMSG